MLPQLLPPSLPPVLYVFFSPSSILLYSLPHVLFIYPSLLLLFLLSPSFSPNYYYHLFSVSLLSSSISLFIYLTIDLFPLLPPLFFSYIHVVPYVLSFHLSTLHFCLLSFFSLVLSTSLISIFCLSLFLPLTPYFLNLASLVTASISISFFPPLHLFASCFLHLICFLLSFLIAFFPFPSFFIIFPQPLSPLPPLLKKWNSSVFLLSSFFLPSLLSSWNSIFPYCFLLYSPFFFLYLFASCSLPSLEKSALHVLFSIWWWKHLLALFGVISTLTL